NDSRWLVLRRKMLQHDAPKSTRPQHHVNSERCYFRMLASPPVLSQASESAGRPVFGPSLQQCNQALYRGASSRPALGPANESRVAWDICDFFVLIPREDAACH